MAWSSPLTAVANAALTAAQWNASVRDNLNETAPAKATYGGALAAHFAVSGTNQIAERQINQASVATSETTASTSYVALATAGPAVTITTGAWALVWVLAQITPASGQSGYMGWTDGGAVVAADAHALVASSSALPHRGSSLSLPSLTPGSNTFTAQYRVNSGTGTFANRRIVVMGL